MPVIFFRIVSIRIPIIIWIQLIATSLFLFTVSATNVLHRLGGGVSEREKIEFVCYVENKQKKKNNCGTNHGELSMAIFIKDTRTIIIKIISCLRAFDMRVEVKHFMKESRLCG